MKKFGLVLVMLVLMFLVVGPGVSSAYLLDERFGVYPTLGTGYSNNPYNPTSATYYPFVASSLLPTKNTATVDYAINDWTGRWSNNNFTYQTISGQYPSGAEPYDVEAYYFDNDATNLYIAVLTSFAPPPGYYETRAGSPLVVSGDLALDFGLGTAYNGFRYNYGVNINNEVRPASSSANATSGGSTTGQGFYRTANSDWYTGTPNGATAANGELTNFDPNFSTFSGTQLGNATVAYRNLGITEGGSPTYVIEATIPISLFDIDLYTGQVVGISWVEGCRNDGNSTEGILRLPGGDVDPVPEPASMLLMGAGLMTWGVIHRRRRKAKS